ncbi:hypothetical protein GLAREA_10715 [Glarea lozoyensis ATCC 20868]|uniref:Uncharacterized protein n=1 Tax=Glarea lozoyensis (strain ATCC 20868 / MF5171) TaxID=1116229 RepID=S3DB97_GLAL2|nr:uncharacterized protein GLAREA_10715 [Glarea lozoyensis ATCC 20868]EPE35020.1 hypothetical protein GLAREA_10715 [Glarea lozoyensis ATCC 20868]
MTTRRICENYEAATVLRVVEKTTILWNFSTFGLDHPDLQPRIALPRSRPQSADQLISPSDRRFVVFVRGREEQALFIRYPAGMIDRNIADCIENDVKISFMKTGDVTASTYSFPDIDIM